MRADTSGLQTSRDAPGNQRKTCKVADILARDAFRTATCGDKGEDFGHI